MLVKWEQIDRRVRGGFEQPGAEGDRDEEEERSPRDGHRRPHGGDAEDVGAIGRDEEEPGARERVVQAEPTEDVGPG